MNFLKFSKEQTMIQHEVNKFTKAVIEPVERDLDEGKADFKNIYEQVVELGFAGSLIPEEFEGAGLDLTSFCLALEEFARSCASLSLVLLVNNALNGLMLLRSEHHGKAELLKKIAGGSIGGFIVPPDFDENTPDSKITGDKTVINSKGIQLTLNGRNPEFMLMPITEADNISFYLIQPADKVELVLISTLGMKIAGICEAKMSNLELMSEDELIRFKDRNEYLNMLNAFRVGLAAIGLGISTAAFDTAFKYAHERKQFGRAIIEFPMIQDMLVTMKTRIEAARRLVFDSAGEQALNPALALMARIEATETAVYCGKESVQILGGYGYTKDYSAERYLRDAKTLQLLIESPFTVKNILMKELL